jgi:predicted nuclease of predicted toxin-antitoxin system
MKFLVDVNLPKYFSYFESSQFIHVVDIDDEMTDSSVWDYALSNNLIILTKDTDFYHRSVASKIKPKVVYFQLGNMTIKTMHDYFERNWLLILNTIRENYLIIVTAEEIEVVI